MIALVRTLLSPLVSLILMNLACGMFNTFISLRLDLEGYGIESIGFVSSALYGGVLIGSLVLGRWIAKVGHITAFIAFCWGSATLAIFHSFWIDPWYWSFLRVLSGICLAGVLIVVESWCLIQSPSDKRGSVLSIYLGVFYLALSFGQFLLNFTPVTTAIPYYTVAAFLFSAALPFKLLKTTPPQRLERTARMALRQVFHHSPVGFIGGITAGMLLGSVYGLVPVYGISAGLDTFQIGTLMAVLIFGGLSLQWPIGVLADRTNRRNVLSLVCFTTFIFTFSIGIMGTSIYPVLLILSWLFGGFAFTIYPLSMAFLCEKLSPEQIVPATGGFILCYGIGAIIGPLIAPLFMDLLGGSGLFYFISLITAGLGICAALKKT